MQANISCKKLRDQGICGYYAFVWNHNFDHGTVQFSLRSLLVWTCCKCLGSPQNSMEYFINNYHPLRTLGKMYSDVVHCCEVNQQQKMDKHELLIEWAYTLFQFFASQRIKIEEGNYDELSAVLLKYNRLQQVVDSFGKSLTCRFFFQLNVFNSLNQSF